MEVWMEKAGPWVEVLLKGVAVTVEVVKGKPRLVIRPILIIAYLFIKDIFDVVKVVGIEIINFCQACCCSCCNERHLFDVLQIHHEALQQV